MDEGTSNSGIVQVDTDVDKVDTAAEPITIFDCSPQAFRPNTNESEPLEQQSDNLTLCVDPNLLPYSWMIQNPGQIPAGICANSPPGWPENLEYTARKLEYAARNQQFSNVIGETLMEEEFKSYADPYDYFFRATGFRCIMSLNSEGRIHPSIFATILGRLFNGQPRFLDVFNRFFMPAGFCIVPTTCSGILANYHIRIENQLKTLPTGVHDDRLIMLYKITNFLGSEPLRVVQDENGRQIPVHDYEVIGKLVCSSNGVEFKPTAGLEMMLHHPELSDSFLRRRGLWWPFKNLSWQEADVLGLCSGDKYEKPRGTVNPRLLIKGLHGAGAGI